MVVGGGCTGLSAALHAAERGLKVVLLEGGKIGWGASGRNGGQMIPGLRKGAKGLVKLYGPERAKVLFDLAFEARGAGARHHRAPCHRLRSEADRPSGRRGQRLRPQGPRRRGRVPRDVMDFRDVEILSAARGARQGRHALSWRDVSSRSAATCIR